MRFLFIGGRAYGTATGVSNSQISSFARNRQIGRARKVFDELREKNSVSWNAIVAGYFENEQPEEAQRLFNEMPLPERNLVSWNGLLSGYARNGMISEARKVFDKMPERNVISWTAMVRGYIRGGRTREAESLFWKMPEKSVISWTVMLGGLVGDGRVDEARKLYDMMPVKDHVARTNMIGGLCMEGRLREARELFDDMPTRNVVAWTAMISGYAAHSRVDAARKLFEVMPEKNEITWTAMLMGYTRSGRIVEAVELFEAMPAKAICASNQIIMALGQSGEVRKARLVFDGMRERDNGSWSAMIKVYERKGFELEALGLFSLMQREGGLGPCFPSMISVLSVCGSLASLDHGRQVHAKLVRSQFDSDVYLSSVLITMYVKCGDLANARRVFDRSASKDVVTWNSTITGYAQHGLVDEALQVFHDMLSSGTAPDDITFIGVLSACGYAGKIEQAFEVFEVMESKYLIDPKTEHYACMVDLLGRAGRINEAVRLIEGMPMEADAIVWGALLGACRIHRRLDVAEVAAERVIEIEPRNAGPYVLLSNIYALKGKWRRVAELRETMRLMNITKPPGCSWIEAEKKVHVFVGGDNASHPEHVAVLGMLEKLAGLLREVGYHPDDDSVLCDLDEEDRVHSLRYHSEKLAVAYGLLKVPEGVPIRVMKNLRVCGDCHSAIKLIAKVTGREIILRDALRFHHFKDGLCSCNDYW